MLEDAWDICKEPRDMANPSAILHLLLLHLQVRVHYLTHRLCLDIWRAEDVKSHVTCKMGSASVFMRWLVVLLTVHPVIPAVSHKTTFELHKRQSEARSLGTCPETFCRQ